MWIKNDMITISNLKKKQGVKFYFSPAFKITFRIIINTSKRHLQKRAAIY